MTHLLAQDLINLTDIDANYSYLSKNITPSSYVITVGNALLGLAGVLGFIYLLWGGVQWITAGGDKDALDKARKKITTALIGMIITFSIFAIMFMIRTLFGISIFGFTLGRLGT
jgi:hypothetical protein